MKFEHIIWQDIIVQSGWTASDNLADTVIIHSVGIYVDENENQVRLAVAYGDESDGAEAEYNGIITIPKGCINSRTNLTQKVPNEYSSSNR